MDARLLDELLEASPFRSGEELVARVRVVEGDLARRFRLLLEEACLFPVAREFRVVPVEVADAVGRLRVTIPAQVLLDGRRGRACAVDGLRRRRGGASLPIQGAHAGSTIERHFEGSYMHAVNNTVRLGLHDVFRAHDGAGILISVRT